MRLQRTLRVISLCLLSLIVLSAWLLPAPSSFAQETECPTPIPIATAADRITFRTLTETGYLVYIVENVVEDRPPSMDLFSVPVDGSAPPLALTDGDYMFTGGITNISPDGTYLSVALDTGEAQVMAVATGEIVMTPTVAADEMLFGPPSFYPDGEHLLLTTIPLASENLRMYRVTFPEGERQLITDRVAHQRFLLQDEQWLIHLTIMADGTPQLLRQSLEPPFTVHNLGGDLDVTRLLVSNVPMVFSLADDYVIFEASAGEGPRQLVAVDTMRADPVPIVLHSPPEGTSTDGIASPDGRYLAFVQADELFLVPVDGSASPAQIATVDPWAYPRFTPDGRYLTYVGHTPDAAGILFFVSLVDETRIAVEADVPFSVNYRFTQLGDTLLIEDTSPGSNRLREYRLPVTPDGSLELLFESEWDYKSWPFVLVPENEALPSDTIIFRQYVEGYTRLYRAWLDGDFAPELIGCPIAGHATLLGIHDDLLVYMVDNTTIYTVPLNPPAVD